MSCRTTAGDRAGVVQRDAGRRWAAAGEHRARLSRPRAPALLTMALRTLAPLPPARLHPRLSQTALVCAWEEGSGGANLMRPRTMPTILALRGASCGGYHSGPTCRPSATSDKARLCRPRRTARLERGRGMNISMAWFKARRQHYSVVRSTEALSPEPRARLQPMSGTPSTTLRGSATDA